MTSSERTELSDEAKDTFAARVGTIVDAPVSTGDGVTMDRIPRVGLACAEFNGGITGRLLSGALDALEEVGCDLGDVVVVWAPGAFELPLVAKRMAESGGVDAVICLGAVIRGDTGHYEFVAGECAAGLQRAQLDTGVPVVFGVLTTDTVDQAIERSETDRTNKGREAAYTAFRMVALLRTVSDVVGRSQVGFAPGTR